MPCGVDAVNGCPVKNVAWISLGVSFPAAKAGATTNAAAAMPANAARIGDLPGESPLDHSLPAAVTKTLLGAGRGRAAAGRGRVRAGGAGARVGGRAFARRLGRR